MKFKEALAKYNIPSSSYLLAINHINSGGDLTGDQYRERIGEIVPDKGHDLNDRDAKYTYKYLVQETLRAMNNTNVINMADMYTFAHTTAMNFIETHQYLFVEREESTEKLDENGNIQPKRGSKRDKTCALWAEKSGDNLSRKEWIALLVSEVGLTPAGASTYYAKLKKGTFGC